MAFGRREIIVNGEKVAFDVEDGLPIVDLSEDMGRVAAQMAWWGTVWAAAEREKIEADSFYRNWRAAKTNKLLELDPKLAEWKIKVGIESDDTFVKMKAALAKAEENVCLAKAVFQSFEKKGSMLQSRGAMARGELGATGMSTPARPKSAPSRPPPVEDDTEDEPAAVPPVVPKDDRVAKMRELNRTKKGLKNG